MEENRNIEMLCIKSFNCRVLCNKSKRQGVFGWLNNYTAGICLLQETHSIESDKLEWEKEFNCDIYFSHGTGNSRGVLQYLFLKKYNRIP